MDQIAREGGGEPLDVEKYAKADWKYKFELLPKWAAKVGQLQWNCYMIPAGDTLKDLLDILNFLKQYEMNSKSIK